MMHDFTFLHFILMNEICLSIWVGKKRRKKDNPSCFLFNYFVFTRTQLRDIFICYVMIFYFENKNNLIFRDKNNERLACWVCLIESLMNGCCWKFLTIDYIDNEDDVDEENRQFFVSWIFDIFFVCVKIFYLSSSSSSWSWL